jgi:hypothetical protein
VRALLSAFIIALPTMILLREWVMATSGAPRSEVRQAFDRVELTLVLVTVAGIAVAFTWALQRRLSLSDTVRVLFGATTPARGWDAPTVARVLAPRAGISHAPAGDSPTEHALAISELAKVMPALGAGLRAELSATAHALLSAIQECDAEVARLSCDASVGELDRLAAQLGAFDADGAAGAERRELRDLLERQLALLRRMRVRCEAVSQERARLFSLLRGLWQQLSIAHDSALERTTTSSAAFDRVHGVLDQIALEMRGQRDVHPG